MKKIGIIGLGYVGLPLAIEFAKSRTVIGFDKSSERISQLKENFDKTLECSSEEIMSAKHLEVTTKLTDLKDCTIYIVAVPTPINAVKQPDLSILELACKEVGGLLKKGDIVICESTVYPGATEEFCVPILEKESTLKYNNDFFCGYSPERINPGDKLRKLSSIVKITSGSNPVIADEIDRLYSSIISAGTFRTSSIKVAEAAKVIENTQRDLNIALMNELSLIFNRLEIDTLEVLEAASTKWNFLPFRPGLVGGHCIGVDPYYLTHKAKEAGYHPEVILAGRRINDAIASFISAETVKLMLRKSISIRGSKALILGFSFKENCPDVRNTKVVDIAKSLNSYMISVDIYDPWIDIAQAEREYTLSYLRQKPSKHHYDTIILAVSHNEFVQLGEKGIRAFAKKNAVIYDVKGILPINASDGRL